MEVQPQFNELRKYCDLTLQKPVQQQEQQQQTHDKIQPHDHASTTPPMTAEGGAHTHSIRLGAHTLTTFTCDWSMRRRVALPPYSVRFLRYIHGAKSKQLEAEAAASKPEDPPSPMKNGHMFDDAATTAGHAGSAGATMSSANSLECMESGAVAGAVPAMRHRRAVEERVVRAALEALAPLSQRAAAAKAASPPCIPGGPAPPVSPGAARKRPSSSELPFDAFMADFGCAHLHARALEVLGATAEEAKAATTPPQKPLRRRRSSLSLTSTTTPSGSGSEYVSALLYLMDVHAAGGDRLVAPRTVADEAAARIVAQHRGDFASIGHALSQLAGAPVVVASEADVGAALRTHAMAVASFAITCENSAGAFAGGPSRTEMMRALLDSEGDTVPLLALPACGLGSVYLLREIYDSLGAYFGAWSMKGFNDAMAALSERGQKHTSSWARMFRSMNRSRSGEISFVEFVAFFTKKVSACGDDVDPDMALVLCLARLRLLHLLFFQRRGDWAGRSFWFDALVDVHDGGF